ncbi:MAG: hypothetical protein IH599_09195 [Bacteroidales bacterium]|nr:hypothetical protein [Bacteroidales bacterium]
MSRQVCILICVLAFFGDATAQPWRISGLENSNRVKLQNDRYFDGNSLWGYMNGGADLYLEYGFRALRVQDMVVDSQEIRLEIFRMDDPYSSRALYSALAAGLTDSSWNRPWIFNPYQIQIVFNDCYINIVNFTGSERGLKACIELSELVGMRFSRLRIDTPPPLDGNHGQWQAFFGPLGCRMVASGLEELLDGLSYSVVWVQKQNAQRKHKAIIYPQEGKESLFLSLQGKLSEQFGITEGEGGSLIVEWQTAGQKEPGGGLW